MEANYDGLVMYGNLDTSPAPSAPASQPSDPAMGRVADRAAARLELWLGDPEARGSFDPTLLGAADRERFGSLRSLRRRQEFEISRALKAFAGVDRPQATSRHSLSHSGGHAALLVGQEDSRIGVDLEVGRPRDVLRIARVAFQKEEVQALEQAEPSRREGLFYCFWTLKEALTKTLQLNLMDGLGQCVFRPTTPNGTAPAWTGIAPTNEPWWARVYRPRDGFFLAVASIGATEPPCVESWEWPPQRAADWPVIADVCVPAIPCAPRA